MKEKVPYMMHFMEVNQEERRKYFQYRQLGRYAKRKNDIFLEFSGKHQVSR